MSRKLQGTVVSDKMDKTVTVAVVRLKEHPIYRKKYRQTSKFKAHDEKSEYRLGDVVEIAETRPISATKRWTVLGLVKKESKPSSKSERPKADKNVIIPSDETNSSDTEMKE